MSNQEQEQKQVRRRRCPLCEQLAYPKDMIKKEVVFEEGMKITEHDEEATNYVIRKRWVHKECYERQQLSLVGEETIKKLEEKYQGQTTLDLF